VLGGKVDGRVDIWPLGAKGRVSRGWSQKVFDGYSPGDLSVGRSGGAKLEMLCLDLLVEEIVEGPRLV